MNLEKFQFEIRQLMTGFVTEIKAAGAMNQTYINRVSENVLVPLLSEIFGHTELKNLNVESYNFPAIDLGDEKTGTAYQITATATSKKIKDTLEKFVKHKLYEKYKHLIIYILKEKQKTYQGRGFDEIIQGKFTFDKKSDIRDYHDLLKEISGFSSVDKLRKIKNILDEHFGDGEYICPLDWLEKVNNSWGEELATIKIEREKLRNDLQDFVLRGNGVVVGKPGVGKTYLLNELRQNLKSAGIPHLRLPIDQLGDGTDEDLQRELSYVGDLIEKLNTVPISDKKGILLFDAFDAARNEQTQKRFQRLIQRTIQQLEGQWNVVVTIRTYDAEKSQELLDLFGNPCDTDLTQYHSKGILCRHFTIPPLNEDEIRQVLDQIPPLKHIYNSVSPEFKQLLAYPFNLWLLEKILKTPQDVQALSQIHSEVQLLGLFWRRRVAPVSKKVHCLPILTQIVQQMVNEHSLTVRLDNMSDNLRLDQPPRETAWDDLFSNEVLVWVASTGQRIAFSHDILFDYAISVLLIEDEPQQLEDFLLQDSARPIFLRPSLTYYFTRLWYDVPEKFWSAFWHIFRSNQSVHIRLASLIPTSVIAIEARAIDQLTPLLDKIKGGEEIANDAIAWLLQSLRALEIEDNVSDKLWSDFFDGVSKHLHRKFAWALAILTSRIQDKPKNSENSPVIYACGRVGRRLLAWIWQERETSEDDWFNRLGSYWAVPLVSKTYGTNVEESRTLLNKVLELTQDDNFPIDFLTDLSEHVGKIWAHDSEFVGLIYRAGITTTHRQDYSMCHYWLAEHFPNFLQAEPLTAAQAAIQSLNSFIIDTHTFRASRHDVTDKEIFNFRRKRAYFVADKIYGEQQIRAEPIKMADALFEFISELAMSNNPLLDSLLDVFRDYVEVAFFWKRLLKTASPLPAVFAPRLFELCIAEPIQMADEVLHELGQFLKIASSEFEPNQRLQIEETILRLPQDRRDQLLAKIPSDLLCTNEAKEIREEMKRENEVPDNRPSAGFGFRSGHYSDEQQLQRQGIDTTAPKNQGIQCFFDRLDKFRSDWLNGEPTEEASELILPTLEEGYATIKGHTEADKQVIDRLWYKLADCTAILARAANNPESCLFAFCRELLLDAARHEQPEPNPDLDAQFNSSAYSPCPRHEAAEGLLRLTVRHPDPKMLDAIERLARDPVPSVRMVTAMELFKVYFTKLDRFWHIVENRAAHETNHVVQEHICTMLTRVVGRGKNEQDRTIRVMDRMLKRTLAQKEKSESPDSFVNLLMWLAFCRESSWALEAIEVVFFRAPIQFGNSLQHAIFWVMREFVGLKHLKTDEGSKTIQRAIRWLEQVIDVASDTIEELCDTSNAARTAETEKKLHDIYRVIDDVIMRLYYAAAYERGQSEEIPNELRCRFYDQVKPIMEKVIALPQDRENGVTFAKTAGYFIQTLTSFLSCNPKEVLHFAVRIARSSESSGYSFDSFAVKNYVNFVEIVLADYRGEVRDGEALEDLLNILDIFVRAGWSDALRLVWRLDEIFR